MSADWTKWAIFVAVASPLLWLLARGAGGQLSAWLVTALVVAIGVRAVFRSQRFDPERYRARRR
jgi:hypothetical protein